MQIKAFFSVFLFFPLVLALVSCDSRIIPLSYVVDLPELPPAWVEVLGKARWRLEWIDGEGSPGIMENALQGQRISLLGEWAHPVLAYPYWPERGIPPGLMRPAGAVFPFDTVGGRIRLSWRGGVEAWFFKELAMAAGIENTGNFRLPQYFDWPRFSALLESPAVSEEVRRDPWAADWSSIARSTIKSGFDQRRLKGQSLAEIAIPIPQGGLWIGTSPFREARFYEDGEQAVFPAGDQIETCISTGGLLRFNKRTWVWLPGGRQ